MEFQGQEDADHLLGQDEDILILIGSFGNRMCRASANHYGLFALITTLLLVFTSWNRFVGLLDRE